jgi:hypothetical protein
MIPPVLISVWVRSNGRTVFAFPLPFVLLWPLVVVLPVLLLPVLAVVQLAIHFTPYRYPLCRVVLVYLEILASLKGLQVYVNGKKDNSLVRISII